MSLYAFIAGPNGPDPVFGENCRSMDEWADIHRQAKGGLLTLPCGCPAVATRRPWRDRKGETRYFAHRPNSGCGAIGKGGGEGAEHVELKSVAKAHLLAKGLEARFEVSGDGYRADIVATNPKTGGEAIVEIQFGMETPDAIEDRMRARIASGKRQIWFFCGDNLLSSVPERTMAEAWCVSIGSDEEGRAARLRKAIDAWISSKLFFDDGTALADCRMELVPLPAICGNCGTEFLCPQYLVARLSETTSGLDDVAIHAKSTKFHILAGGLLKEPWDGRPFARIGHDRQLCPRCGKQAPEFRMAKDAAKRSPAGHPSFAQMRADARGMSGLDFPRWRERARPKRQAPLTEAQWTAMVESLSGPGRLAAKKEWAAKRLEREEERRRKDKIAREEEEALARATAAGDARVAEMRILAAKAVAAVDADIDFETWFTGGQFFWTGRQSAARTGGWSYDRLKERLEAIIGLGGPDARDCARKIIADKEGTQDLPIEHLLSPWRKVFDGEKRAWARNEVAKVAADVLGSMAIAEEWMAEPNQKLGGTTPTEALATGDLPRLPDLGDLVERQAPAWLEARSRREKLRNAAETVFGSAADQWMRHPLDGYGDITPFASCVTPTGYETCLNILARLGKGRR